MIWVDMSDIFAHFTIKIKDGSLVLDAGFVFGRDTKAFFDMSFKVDEFDATMR